MIDWLIALINWLIDWFDWLIDWLIDSDTWFLCGNFCLNSVDKIWTLSYVDSYSLLEAREYINGVYVSVWVSLCLWVYDSKREKSQSMAGKMRQSGQWIYLDWDIWIGTGIQPSLENFDKVSDSFFANCYMEGVLLTYTWVLFDFWMEDWLIITSWHLKWRGGV